MDQFAPLEAQAIGQAAAHEVMDKSVLAVPGRLEHLGLHCAFQRLERFPLGKGGCALHPTRLEGFTGKARGFQPAATGRSEPCDAGQGNLAHLTWDGQFGVILGDFIKRRDPTAVIGTSSYEGRYARAEKSARVAFATGEEPGLAALIAARAAHHLNQPQSRDEWIARAREVAVKSDGKPLLHALLMTQAELLADARRDREALEVLSELNRSGARHIAAQRLALKSMTRAGAWEDALRTARQLEDHRAIHPAVAAKTREAAYVAWFDTNDPQTLRERLRRVSKADRRAPIPARIIARALVSGGLRDEARDLVETALDEQWDDVLGALYADCAGDDSLANRALLERAEAWRTRYPREHGLLLVLGRLCARDRLWGKAREYLEEAVAVRPQRAAYLELARLFDAMSKVDDANRCYRLAAQPD